MSAPKRNLEVKARLADLRATEQIVRTLSGLRGPDVQQQVDTYFHARAGRLKLRQIDGRRGELIWYDRPDEADARTSSYHVLPVSDPGALKAALAHALGVRGEVRKRRRIYLWHNVRIHLDEVESLGSFLEFEAVLAPGDDEPTSRDRLGLLCERLGIRESDHIAGSYSDLLGL